MFKFPALSTLTCALREQAAPSSNLRRCDFPKRGRPASAAKRHAFTQVLHFAFLMLTGLAIPGPAQTATPAATFLSFNAAPIGLSAGSAQTLTASFKVSGYAGSLLRRLLCTMGTTTRWAP